MAPGLCSCCVLSLKHTPPPPFIWEIPTHKVLSFPEVTGPAAGSRLEALSPLQAARNPPGVNGGAAPSGDCKVPCPLTHVSPSFLPAAPRHLLSHKPQHGHLVMSVISERITGALPEIYGDTLRHQVINSNQQAMHLEHVNPRAWPAALQSLYVPSETRRWPAAQLLSISKLLKIYDKSELMGRSEGGV